MRRKPRRKPEPSSFQGSHRPTLISNKIGFPLPIHDMAVNPLVYSISGYFVILFTLSWGSVFLAAGGWGGIPLRPDDAEKLLPVLVAGTLLGPSCGGFAMRGWQDMTKALQHEWRLGAVHYAFATLTAPLLILTILVPLSQKNEEIYSPALFTRKDKAALMSVGLGYGAAAGLFEEIGWSGFLVPAVLRLGYTSLQTGILVGIVWGIWHFFVAYMSSGGDEGQFLWEKFAPWIPWNLLVLPSYRILMVWLFQKTGQSFLLQAVMHGVLTASLPLILMPPCEGYSLSFFYMLFGFALAGVGFVVSKASKFSVSLGKKVT